MQRSAMVLLPPEGHPCRDPHGRRLRLWTSRQGQRDHDGGGDRADHEVGVVREFKGSTFAHLKKVRTLSSDGRMFTQPDPKHIDMVVKLLGLGEGKPAPYAWDFRGSSIGDGSPLDSGRGGGEGVLES